MKREEYTYIVTYTHEHGCDSFIFKTNLDMTKLCAVFNNFPHEVTQAMDIENFDEGRGETVDFWYAQENVESISLTSLYVKMKLTK